MPRREKRGLDGGERKNFNTKKRKIGRFGITSTPGKGRGGSSVEGREKESFNAKER
jgi:hypothetical protein